MKINAINETVNFTFSEIKSAHSIMMDLAIRLEGSGERELKTLHNLAFQLGLDLRDKVADQIEVTPSVVVNKPEWFLREDFMAWLNNSKDLMTWHKQGQAPGEFSDTMVFIDPSFNGEGSDSENMPEDIWAEIVEVAKKATIATAGHQNHIPVRITNL